eukprot:139347-Prymnesium_polylepis.1
MHMEEAAAAGYMQAAAGPSYGSACRDRAAAPPQPAARTAASGPASPTVVPDGVLASPRVRASRGWRERVSQPPPLGAAAATP